MKILRSALLEKCEGVVHGFVHDPGGPDIQKIASEHGLRDIVTVKQVHGDSVFFAAESAGDRPVQADSVVAREKGVGVGVVTADCVPILLCFPDLGCVCAVHAGWRGTFSRIVRNCVLAITRKYSRGGGEVLAAIGPAIGRCCYEVRNDVASQFVSRFGDGEGWLLEKGEGKFLLDIVELNRIQLCASGVSQIEVMDVCTCCGDLPSYRKDGSGTDKMLSFVGISG